MQDKILNIMGWICSVIFLLMIAVMVYGGMFGGFLMFSIFFALVFPPFFPHLSQYSYGQKWLFAILALFVIGFMSASPDSDEELQMTQEERQELAAELETEKTDILAASERYMDNRNYAQVLRTTEEYTTLNDPDITKVRNEAQEKLDAQQRAARLAKFEDRRDDLLTGLQNPGNQDFNDLKQAVESAQSYEDVADDRFKTALQNARSVHADNVRERGRRQTMMANAELWNVSRGISSMDDSPYYRASLGADNRVDVWLDKVRPILIVRCQENTTDLIFRAETQFDVVRGAYEQARVRYRIDDGSPTSQLWSESTDNEAAFALSAIPMLRRMQNATKFRVEFTPFNANPVMAEFDIRGIKPHLEKISNMCNWGL